MGDDRDIPHSKHKKEKHKDRDREREKSRRDSRGERDERHPARKEVDKVRPAGRPLYIPEGVHVLFYVQVNSIQCYNAAQHITTVMRINAITSLSQCMRARDIICSILCAITQPMLD